jgi:hypothetical protein
MMRRLYTLEIGYLCVVIAVSLVGFSSLVGDEFLGGEQPALTGYHLLHISTSLAWLLLLLWQLLLLRQQGFRRHRAIGQSIFVAGPVLIATLMLLSVNSASKATAAGIADVLLVQNVGTTLEVALLVLLAFFFRRNRDVHGAFMLSSTMLFLGIALFFTFISYVPKFRIEGPETFHRFAEAGQAIFLIILAVGLLFFLKQWRTGWPWLLASVLFTLNGWLPGFLERTGRAKPYTDLVASIGRVPAFVVSLVGFAALLGLAWNVAPGRRAARPATQ